MSKTSTPTKADLRARFAANRAVVIAEAEAAKARQAAEQREAAMLAIGQRAEDAQRVYLDQALVACVTPQSFSEARRNMRQLLRRLAEEILDQPGKPGPKAASDNTHPFLSRREMQTRFRTEVADCDLEQRSVCQLWMQTDRGAVRMASQAPAATPEWDLPRVVCPQCGNPKARQEPALTRIVNGVTHEEHPVRCRKCNPLKKRRSA